MGLIFNMYNGLSLITISVALLFNRFCRGCLLECNESPIGDDPHYLAIDWDDAFLHLKYQSALERVITNNINN